MNALEIKGLKKSFGKNRVIDELSFHVPDDKIVGLLGKNGAGKTTTMNMVLGFLKSDGGEIKVFGEEVKYGLGNANKNIGYLPDVPAFYGYMRPHEYLKLCGEISGLSKAVIKERTAELLELVGLEGVNKKIGGFSRGMKQRLGIAQALLNDPKLLICDEPTSALDPIGRRDILDILAKLRGKTAVILSTHILSDVEAVCDDVVIIDHGRNVLSGALEDLKNMKRNNDINLKFKSSEEMDRFARLCKSENIEIHKEYNQLSISGFEDVNARAKQLFEDFIKLDVYPLEMRIEEPSLENIFMEVVRK